MQLRFDLSTDSSLTELVNSATRQCTRCGVFKPLSEFGKVNKRNDGLNPWCKACKSIAGAEYRAKCAAKNEGRSPSIEGTKRCSACGLEKPKTEFVRSVHTKDGLFYACKECSRKTGMARNARYAAEHKLNPPSLDGTKLCPICGKEKPRSEFCLSSSSKDGFHKYCRACDKVKCKETAAKNREKHTKYPPSTDGTKLCKKCGEVKPKTEFYINKSAKDGLSHCCSSCKERIGKVRKVANAADRVLHPASLDTLKKCSTCGIEKPIREFFKSESNKDGRSFRCKSCALALDRQYRDDHPENRWAVATINGHRRRGYEMVITTAELTAMAESTKKCPICGCVLDWGRKENGHLLPNSPTLDRKNNDQRITVESTLILCHRCNSAKHDFTIAELSKWCDDVKRWIERGALNDC